MRHTLCKPIPQHKPIPNQPVWRNNLQHHLARQPSQSKKFAKNCARCAEERIAILKQSKSNPQLLVNSDNEICALCACTDESINDARASSTNKVTTDSAGHNVCMLAADVQLEAPTKSDCFLSVSKALTSETILTICHKQSVFAVWHEFFQLLDDQRDLILLWQKISLPEIVSTDVLLADVVVESSGVFHVVDSAALQAHCTSCIVSTVFMHTIVFVIANSALIVRKH